MKYHLRSYDLSPPGGFPYEQTEGLRKNFPSLPLIEDQAKAVSAFRTRNGLARAGLREALEDVDRFQCLRLGNMPAFCVPCDQAKGSIALNQSSPIVAPPCHGCGIPINQ